MKPFEQLELLLDITFTGNHGNKHNETLKETILSYNGDNKMETEGDIEDLIKFLSDKSSPQSTVKDNFNELSFIVQVMDLVYEHSMSGHEELAESSVLPEMAQTYIKEYPKLWETMLVWTYG